MINYILLSKTFTLSNQERSTTRNSQQDLVLQEILFNTLTQLYNRMGGLERESLSESGFNTIITERNG